MALRLCVAVLLGLLALPAQPVQAQSFFPSLYGYGSPSPRSYRYPRMSPYRMPYPSPYGGPFFSPDPPYGDEARPPERLSTYRTLCVRLCDGYYFPISSAATQDSFARDADTCSASCGAEARLFYHPNVGGDVDTMVDLTGIAYSALPNAFRYRKTLVESCRCRPQPWSEAEQQRHRAYAQGQSVAAERTRRAAAACSRRPSVPPAVPPRHLRAALARRSAHRGAPAARLPGTCSRAGWPFANSDVRGTPRSRYEWPGDHSRNLSPARSCPSPRRA